MARWIVITLIVVPVAELATAIWVGQQIGALETVLLLILLSLLGMVVVKRQGLGIWRRIQGQVASGEVPGRELVDGGLVLAAGGLLLVPGFLTDIVGLLLLVPPVRDLVRAFAGRRIARRVGPVTTITQVRRVTNEAPPPGPGGDRPMLGP